MTNDKDLQSRIDTAVALLKQAALVGPLKSYNLSDDFDFNFYNDTAWLEAVANNPQVHSITASAIAMVALELNKRIDSSNFPVVLDGWKLVPIYATANMSHAGHEYYQKSKKECGD